MVDNDCMLAALKDDDVKLKHQEEISLKDFNNEIDKILNNKYPRGKQIVVNNKPANQWIEAGLKDVKIVMPVAVFLKATKEKHNVNENTIRNLPVLLCNPRYIFKSSSDNISLVGVLDAYEINNAEKKPLIVVVKPVFGKAIVNIISSIYGKDKDFISREIHKGNLLYQR